MNRKSKNKSVVEKLYTLCDEQAERALLDCNDRKHSERLYYLGASCAYRHVAEEILFMTRKKKVKRASKKK